MAATVVSNGFVVDPSQGIERAMDLTIEDGVITELTKPGKARKSSHSIDATGLIIAPGFVDLHTHLREPGGEGAETIETGTRAAAAGGFTTIFCMPNTNPVCDSETGIQYVLSRAKTHGCVNVVPVAAITKGSKGEELTNFGRLRAAGAGAFSDDGRPIMNAEIMRRALECTRLLGMPVLEHCECLNLTGDGVMHEGPVSLRLGLKGIPRASESIMVSRNISLAEMTGGHIHICHVSTRESVEAVRAGKKRGVRVTAEVSPHHLTMTDVDVNGYDTNAKMKPPLNAEADRLALVDAIEDGTIDCIATDHAPHSAQSKQTVFDQAPFGIIGMETAFPVLYTHFVATKRWSLGFLVEKMSIAPARVVGGPWGTLKVGAKADVTLLQLDHEYTFGLSHLRSKSTNCPWLGHAMSARIAATLVQGRVAFESNEVYPRGVFEAPVADGNSARKKLKSRKKK